MSLLYIVAVSQGGDVVARSQPSDPIVDTTGVTGQQNKFNGL